MHVSTRGRHVRPCHVHARHEQRKGVLNIAASTFPIIIIIIVLNDLSLYDS